jgi:peptide subunit release factor RF-3
VFQSRLSLEYGVEVLMTRRPYTRARWMRKVTDDLLDLLPMVVLDESSRPVALFQSQFEIDYARERYKEMELLEHPPAEEDKS